MNQFILPAGFEAQQVVELLENETAVATSAIQAVITESPTSEQVSIYDTFDWRLYNQKFALFSVGSQFTLRDLVEGKTAVQLELDELPQFVWDMPPGLFRAKLAPILSMRALLPMANVSHQKTVHRLLNEDEKTVAWVMYEVFAPVRNGETALLQLLSIQPVRGYVKAETQLVDLCHQQNFEATDDEIIPMLLMACGHEPGSYSAKLNVDLKPDMRADAAVNVILRYLFQVMKMNEQYIKQDVDTEFLHDYRVSVRRTRSALSQVNAVFPEAYTQRFKKDFKFIGKLSNQLRDLDVYLLAEADYKAKLPEFLQEDIHPLFEYLQSKREDALQAVISELDSAEYRRIVQDWELFLEEPPTKDKTAVNATMPILELAQKRIYKRYQRIIKVGNAILKDQQDELLHALRLECKNLRYLMEFFATLFPPDQISILIRQLKQLQDNLGDFNDFCVQEVYLLHVGREMPIRGQASRDALIAIGCLVGALHQRREQVKSEFAGTFTSFAAPQNKALFTDLFAPHKKDNKKKGGKA
ncbi:MAG: CHAD domain-containing protein [Anaerolineae bacterium]|nr:CHAD domain-containing protein [Anaerolineae bacterium]